MGRELASPATEDKVGASKVVAVSTFLVVSQGRSLKMDGSRNWHIIR
jgi:hypothetical protein